MTPPSARTNKIAPPRAFARPAGFPSTLWPAPAKSAAQRVRRTDPKLSPIPSAPRTHFQLSRRALLALGALVLLPWVVVLLLLWRLPSAAPVAPPAPESAPPAADNLSVAPGPWGELQYSRFLIEPPDEFVGPALEEVGETRWFFRGYSTEMLTQLWRSAGLSETQIAELGRHSSVLGDPGGIQVQPPLDLVQNLTPSARGTIYAVLAAFPENGAQSEPFRFRADSVDEWLADSPLSPESLALVRRLFYRRGNSILFSDLPVVMPRIPAQAERINLLKTLARKATLLVKLRVRPTSDLDSIAEYWERGPRRKSVHALLESISHRPEGTTIDIVHLLPKFARAHLFTYPNSATLEQSRERDCHWTSLNFFNDIPDDRFMDVEFVKHTLETDYVAASGRLLLGDILAFVTPQGQVIHSCVFVAGDIVFTKNGGAESAPWILMNLPDLIAFYPADPPLTVRAYRRKDL
jgi:hypothetical protein